MSCRNWRPLFATSLLLGLLPAPAFCQDNSSQSLADVARKLPAIIGRTIRINTVPTVLIGVMHRGFRFPSESDLWIPLTASARSEDRGNGTLLVFGRLAAGASLDSARAELETIASRLADQYPETNKDIGTLVQNYNHMAIKNKLRAAFLMMMAAVGFVLLIACANVANLLLARAGSGIARCCDCRFSGRVKAR